MMMRARLWWQERSARERQLIAVMAGLGVVVLCWLAVIRPMQGALHEVEQAHRAALLRYGKIMAVTGAVAPSSIGQMAPVAPIDQIVSESAGEAGLTLDVLDPQGAGRVDVSVAVARAPALFTWLAQLERRHVVVETFHMAAAGDGTVSLRCVLAYTAGRGG